MITKVNFIIFYRGLVISLKKTWLQPIFGGIVIAYRRICSIRKIFNSLNSQLMIDVHPQYIKDVNGEESLVILSVKEFVSIMEELEELNDIKLYDYREHVTKYFFYSFSSSLSFVSSSLSRTYRNSRQAAYNVFGKSFNIGFKSWF